MDNLPEQPGSPLFFSRLQSPRNLIVFIVVVLFLGSVAAFGISRNQTIQKTPQTSTPTKENIRSFTADLSPHTLVYGTWSDQLSRIMAADLKLGKEIQLAELPSTVKKISVLNNNQLLYINKTDQRDYGMEITLLSLKDQQSQIILAASDGYGIDDFVLSPNKKYMAVLAIQVSAETGVLAGGKTRVYTVDITNPTNKYLIYDEIATSTTPIHYPVAILDTGDVFLDSFVPNTNAGWAYGMSTANFDGSQKQDLDSMRNGTYGTRPALSSDGQYLVFAGYDGANGDGTQIIRGFRRAILSADTIERLDTTTRQRQKVPGVPSGNTFTDVAWGVGSESFIYNQISDTESATGKYLFTLSSASPMRITSPNPNANSAVKHIANDTLLIGEENESQSAVGDLGSTYEPLVSNVFLRNLTTRQDTPLPLANNFVQIIDVLPSSYFTMNTSYAFDQAPIMSTRDTQDDNKQLQLLTFHFKPQLAPVRTQVNNTGGCTELQVQQCMERGNTEEYCRAIPGGSKHCWGCPLYLYGNTGQTVQAYIHTPVFNANLPYQDRYNVTLLENGVLQSGEQTANKITFNYTPALPKITAPTKGTIVAREDLASVVSYFAARLGLNKKETSDLIAEATQKATSPFVFVSFFDHETSNAILPMTFSPKPDVYRNIIFYFKQLPARPSVIPAEPSFDEIQRYGFTAVEISLMVE